MSRSKEPVNETWSTEIFFFKNNAENEAERLVPNFFFKNFF